jgi:hypothetical protein
MSGTSIYAHMHVQGGSNMTGTNCDLFTHKSSRSYLNHLVIVITVYGWTRIRIAESMAVAGDENSISRNRRRLLKSTSDSGYVCVALVVFTRRGKVDGTSV